MDLYTRTAYSASRTLTDAYSTSFGLSIRLFAERHRAPIYAIYGLVRVADEIVDTYQGEDAAELLDELERDTYRALKTGYSTNPLVQAFADTARKHAIDRELIEPFFTSMRMDLTPQHYTQELYETYIYGSAEVVGLMCLKVVTTSDDEYNSLKEGARRLGAAYQKVNFLRDIAADQAINRWYFPGGSFETFDEAQKQAIVADIKADMAAALEAINRLPRSAQKAIRLSYRYYLTLLEKIDRTSAAQLKSARIRVPDSEKLRIWAWVAAGGK